MTTLRFSAAALALFFANGVMAGDCVDVPGADHPRIQRYADACLIAHEVKDFDEVTLPTGAVVMRDGNRVPERAETLEGRATRLMYLAPHGRSSLEVFRNYQRSLEGQGFEVVFSCSTTDCDDYDGRRIQDLVYPTSRAMGRPGQHSYSAFNSGVKDRRYLAARSQDGGTWVGLFVAQATHIFLSDDKDRVAVHIDVVEREAMQERMVDATVMAQSIGESGSVTLENIYFEFGSATLTPQSDAAIAETAKLLRDNPRLELYIVGHTDAVGGYESNLELSRRRAEAVVAALAGSHGIASGRVVPAGVGPLAPVASNASEEGRAQNRRVELVAR